MSSGILDSFEAWLSRVTDEELLTSLREVDADLSLAQQEAEMELCVEKCKIKASSVIPILVAIPAGYTDSFEDVCIVAA